MQDGNTNTACDEFYNCHFMDKACWTAEGHRARCEIRKKEMLFFLISQYINVCEYYNEVRYIRTKTFKIFFKLLCVLPY